MVVAVAGSPLLLFVVFLFRPCGAERPFAQRQLAAAPAGKPDAVQLAVHDTGSLAHVGRTQKASAMDIHTSSSGMKDSGSEQDSSLVEKRLAAKLATSGSSKARSMDRSLMGKSQEAAGKAEVPMEHLEVPRVAAHKVEQGVLQEAAAKMQPSKQAEQESPGSNASTVGSVQAQKVPAKPNVQAKTKKHHAAEFVVGAPPTPSQDEALAPDYESRPRKLKVDGRSLGDCTVYKDTLPGNPLGDTSHSVVVALRFNEDAADAGKRQWLLNIGQHGSGAEHWLHNAHHHEHSIQFGAWNGRQIGKADITKAKIISTTYDQGSKQYKLYLDGKLSQMKKVHLNIKSQQMLVGDKGNYKSDLNFQGCVQGVDVYRKVLQPEEVEAASKRMLASLEMGDDDKGEKNETDEDKKDTSPTRRRTRLPPPDQGKDYKGGGPHLPPRKGENQRKEVEFNKKELYETLTAGGKKAKDSIHMLKTSAGLKDLQNDARAAKRQQNNYERSIEELAKSLDNSDSARNTWYKDTFDSLEAGDPYRLVSFSTGKNGFETVDPNKFDTFQKLVDKHNG